MRYEEVINDLVTQSDDTLIPCLKSINPQSDLRLENNEFQFQFESSNKYKHFTILNVEHYDFHNYYIL